MNTLSIAINIKPILNHFEFQKKWRTQANAARQELGLSLSQTVEYGRQGAEVAAALGITPANALRAAQGAAAVARDLGVTPATAMHALSTIASAAQVGAEVGTDARGGR